MGPFALCSCVLLCYAPGGAGGGVGLGVCCCVMGVCTNACCVRECFVGLGH